MDFPVGFYTKLRLREIFATLQGTITYPAKRDKENPHLQKCEMEDMLVPTWMSQEFSKWLVTGL